MGTQESFLAAFLVHTLFGFVKDRDLGFALLGFQSRGFQLNPDAFVCHRVSPW